jgi:hypothetical protein
MPNAQGVGPPFVGHPRLLIQYIVACRGVWLLDMVWIGWMNLLTPYTQHSELQAITANLRTLQFTAANTRVVSLLKSQLSVSW